MRQAGEGARSRRGGPLPHTSIQAQSPHCSPGAAKGQVSKPTGEGRPAEDTHGGTAWERVPGCAWKDWEGPGSWDRVSLGNASFKSGP